MLPSLVLLFACGSAEVHGGSDEQRALVTAVWLELEQAAGVELNVAGIRFRSVKRGAGRYNSVTREIALDATLVGDELERAARHEVCHALDFQLGFRPYEDPAWRLVDPALATGSKRRQAREAFAYTCGVSPVSNAAIVPCGTSDLDGALQDLLDELLPDAPRPALLQPEWVGVTELPAGSTLDGAGVTASGVLRLSAGVRTIDVDLAGQPAVSTDAVVELALGVDTTLEDWTFRLDALPLQVGDDVVGIAARTLVDGSVPTQLFVWTGGSPAATACAQVDDRWFAWDGGIWLVRQEGDTVRWGPLR